MIPMNQIIVIPISITRIRLLNITATQELQDLIVEDLAISRVQFQAAKSAIAFCAMNSDILQGQRALEFRFQRGLVVELKNFRLAIARHDPLQHTSNFYPGRRIAFRDTNR